MMKFCDRMLSQMLLVVENKPEANPKTVLSLEYEINDYRKLLKELNVNDLNAQRYSYQMGVHYMDLINDCEKLGDYVVNVVEAHNNKKFA
jgi:Na+/phosphate symporter